MIFRDNPVLIRELLVTLRTKRSINLLAALGIASLSRSTAVAQDVAKPVPAGTPSAASSIVIIFPLIFLGLLLVMMRRSRKVQPLMDRSILIAEEGLQLTREQIALQKETNRLLGQLVTDLRREG